MRKEKNMRRFSKFTILLAAVFLLQGCEDDAATTFSQVDRQGVPAVNTVFHHPQSVSTTDLFDKTAYNLALPADDVATYLSLFTTVLTATGNADPAGTAAAVFLPDVMPINLGSTTSNFATLDGRKLEDDATDVALTVAVGAAALQSDNVDANDKAFLSTFPYLAAPH